MSEIKKAIDLEAYLADMLNKLKGTEMPTDRANAAARVASEILTLHKRQMEYAKCKQQIPVSIPFLDV